MERRSESERERTFSHNQFKSLMTNKATGGREDKNKPTELLELMYCRKQCSMYHFVMKTNWKGYNKQSGCFFGLMKHA